MSGKIATLISNITEDKWSPWKLNLAIVSRLLGQLFLLNGREESGAVRIAGVMVL